VLKRNIGGVNLEVEPATLPKIEGLANWERPVLNKNAVVITSSPDSKISPGQKRSAKITEPTTKQRQTGQRKSSQLLISVNVLALKRNVMLKGFLNGPKDLFEDRVEFFEWVSI
jgi:hypothetical protein